MAERIWVCPNPNHKGVRAPGRMRLDDVRRYCWPCSLEVGYLVQRHAPALERRRKDAKAKRLEREQAQRQRKRETKANNQRVALTDATGRTRELDVRGELRRALTDMGYFDGWATGHKPTIDDLNITIRRGQKSIHTGRAMVAGFDVWFTFGRGATWESGLELIYHEGAHLASPNGERHGARFHRILADALQKRWPWIVYGSLSPRQPGGCYEMGRRVVRQMEAHVAEGHEL
jgi:hypothetical protein